MALTTLVAIIPAKPASAGTIGVSGSTLVFQGNPGEVNRVTMRLQTSNNRVVVGDSLGTITADEVACTQPNQNTAAECDPSMFTSISVALADGDDSLTVSDGVNDSPFTIPVSAEGGDGDDTLSGLEENDSFSGGDGNDSLTAKQGNDQLIGGEGNDVLTEGLFGAHGGDDGFDGGGGDDTILTGEGPDGADTVSGGSGNDTLNVGLKSVGVTILIDGQPNDGTPGEGDNYAADIESYTLTQNNDAWAGGGHGEFVLALAGDDGLDGGGGNDSINGQFGNDSIDGGAGDDLLVGHNDNDTITGGAGRDDIHGDGTSGSDTASGRDTVEAVDGEVDTIECGSMTTDSARVDANDVVDASIDDGCEAVTRVGGGGGGGGDASPGDSFPMSVSARRLGAFQKRGLPVRVTCPAQCLIMSKLTVSASRARKLGLGSTRTIARGSGSLPAAGTEKVTLKVVKKAKRHLRNARKLKATVTTRIAVGARRLTAKRRVTLRR